MSRALNRMNLFARRRRKKFFLTFVHMKKRREWAKCHEKWTTQNWEKVIFSDESKFNLFGSDGIMWCRRGPGEEFHRKNVDQRVKHGGGSVMVWGCMTSKGFGRLYRINGIMDRFYYVEILKEALLGTLEDQGLSKEDIIFQQDNDRKHTSAHARKFFEETSIKLLPWPSNSPDMSIIEHAWSHLDRQVRKRMPRPITVDQLWEVLQEEWVGLGEAYKNKLYESMPRRVAALKAAGGRHTKY